MFNHTNIFVWIYDGDLEGAIKIFKKKVKGAGILSELKRRSHFVPKSQARYFKAWRAQARNNRRASRHRYESR